MATKSKKQKELIEAIKNKARELGWKDDKYGHMQRVGSSGQSKARLKFQDISVRYEIKINEPGHNWVLRSSSYYKDVKIEDDGLVLGRYRMHNRPKSLA
jgi:hypothetical protein